MAPAAWDDTTTTDSRPYRWGYLGEAAHKAETIGEDVGTPFWPSDYGAKNK